MSSDISPVNFAAVAFAVKDINKVLLRDTGHVLACKVDDKNHIVDVEVMPAKEAIAKGFEPAKFIGKEK